VLLALLSWLVAAQAGPVEVVRIGRGFIDVFALVGEGGVVLVDTHYPKRADWVLRKLAKAGVEPDDIELILLTHGHADHAGAALALRERLGVPVAVGPGDVWMLENGTHGKPQPQGLIARLIAPTIKKRYPALTPDLVVIDGLDLREYGVDARAETVGGHTAGSVVVWLPEDAVLVGDLIRSSVSALHAPRTHFFHEDSEWATKEVADLLDQGATLLIPSHGGDLEPERVRRWVDRKLR
jgi:hydroxyacylglutathione hydrolase